MKLLLILFILNIMTIITGVLDKSKPTQLSGFIFGGPLGPYFELF